jgi:hypothetical protein
LVKPVLTEQDKRDLKAIAVDILEIRRLFEKLAETLVNLSDKELLKFCEASQDDDVKENQVDEYEETLEKQLDKAKKEFRL